MKGNREITVTLPEDYVCAVSMGMFLINCVTVMITGICSENVISRNDLARMYVFSPSISGSSFSQRYYNEVQYKFVNSGSCG